MADIPRMPRPEVDLPALLASKVNLGRTIWNWRTLREEGPVPELSTVADYQWYLVTTCADGHTFIDDDEDKLRHYVQTYMIRAYPRGGRTKSRRN